MLVFYNGEISANHASRSLRKERNGSECQGKSVWLLPRAPTMAALSLFHVPSDGPRASLASNLMPRNILRSARDFLAWLSPKFVAWNVLPFSARNSNAGKSDDEDHSRTTRMRRAAPPPARVVSDLFPLPSLVYHHAAPATDAAQMPLKKRLEIKLDQSTRTKENKKCN